MDDRQASSSEGLAEHASRAVSAIVVVTLALTGMWVLEITDYMVTRDDGSGSLDQYGIRAHDVNDLPHIFTAPFLHAGFAHIMANSVPFLVLGFLAALRGIGKFLIMNRTVIVTAGLGVWFPAPTTRLTLAATTLLVAH